MFVAAACNGGSKHGAAPARTQACSIGVAQLVCRQAVPSGAPGGGCAVVLELPGVVHALGCREGGEGAG